MVLTTQELGRNRFSHIILTDVLPRGSSLPLFLPTQTPDNQSSSIDRAVELLVTCAATKLCIINNLGPSRPGYPGAEVWIEEFRKRNVARENLALVGFTGELLTTLTEAFAMVTYAQEHNCSELAITAPGFHLVRCALSIITAVLTLGGKLKVYCQVGRHLPLYSGPLRHSQAREFADRTAIMDEEFSNTERYQMEGTPVPLVSYTRALEYLRSRDMSH